MLQTTNCPCQKAMRGESVRMQRFHKFGSLFLFPFADFHNNKKWLPNLRLTSSPRMLWVPTRHWMSRHAVSETQWKCSMQIEWFTGQRPAAM